MELFESRHLLIMNQKKRTQISGKVEVKEAREGSTIIGVSVGLDEEKVRQVLREEFTSLLSQPGRQVTQFGKALDPTAGALFACEAKRKSTMGFAVNNSGLIICPSIVKPITHIRQLTSGKVFPATLLSRSTMLQALTIKKTTEGLIPSYRYYPNFDEELFTFDAYGKRCKLSVDSISARMKISLGKDVVTLDDIFIARFKPPASLIGGPVINESDEVMGIAIAATDRGFLMVQPWSRIENCIRMAWE